MAHFLCHLGCSHFGALLLDFYFTENRIGSPLAVRFVQKANEFPCHITISHKARTINAKSLLGVLSLEIRHQDEVTLTAEGDQEAQAVSELAIILK